MEIINNNLATIAWQIIITAIISLAIFTILGLIYPIVIIKEKKGEIIKEHKPAEDILEHLERNVERVGERRSIVDLYLILRERLIEKYELVIKKDMTEREVAEKIASRLGINIGKSFLKIYKVYERVRFSPYTPSYDEVKDILSLAKLLSKILGLRVGG